METAAIALPSHLVGQLQAACQSSHEADLSAYVTSILERHLIAISQKSWMPRSRWRQLAQGVDCPICSHLRRNAQQQPDCYAIADLRISQLCLMRNQFVKGYCVLNCHRHVREPYELDPDDQRRFFDDLMRAGRALENVFKPIKMNFELLGNATPHLHCHIKPRYYGDPAPGIPIDPNLQTVHLPQERYGHLVTAIRAAL